MHPNRFLAETETYRLPKPPTPGITVTGFVMYMLAGTYGLTQGQQVLYQLAFAQAQEAARPSLPERDLLGVWN